TGLDLVHLQLRIAAGEPLPFRQEDVRWRGSAIECRIYAEDPASGFLPSPGTIRQLAEPCGPGIRLDSGVYEGWTVPIDYDPLLAKLAVWSETRDVSIARMKRAIGEYAVEGIRTNLRFFADLLNDPEFQAALLHTGFIEEFLKRNPMAANNKELARIAAIAAALHVRDNRRRRDATPTAISRWQTEGRRDLLR
ncbi:MAG TPA: hypothetical protein VN610_01650, partial [Bryobacteraceae bacterium]|nr:hypothetical protein [Bryobacteraceae bacterium]